METRLRTASWTHTTLKTRPSTLELMIAAGIVSLNAFLTSRARTITIVPCHCEKCNDEAISVVYCVRR